jgi:hypothetical protein
MDDVSDAAAEAAAVASPPPAPLGRYAHLDDGPQELHTVRLINLAIALFLRGREHHDDLIREFTLMAIRQQENANAPHLSRQLSELVETLGHRYSASASRADAARDAAIERGEASVDLTYEVPANVVPDLLRLTELIDAADEFCRTEQLLTLPRDPDMVAFAHWYNGEFINQINGLPPTPWSGPLS